MTNLHAAIPEEKLTGAYRLLLEMRDNCVKHADDQYDDPKREAKYEALNIAITAMGRSIPPRWISVKEKLPKDYEDVVIIMRDGASSWYRVAYREYGGWSFGGGRRVNDEVTHWMPIPQPPKEE